MYRQLQQTQDSSGGWTPREIDLAKQRSTSLGLHLQTVLGLLRFTKYPVVFVFSSWLQGNFIFKHIFCGVTKHSIHSCLTAYIGFFAV